MSSTSTQRLVRPAAPADADALQEIYREDGEGDFAALLAHGAGTPGTTHYVIESGGQVAGAFSLTRLGRLRPDGAPRVFLHEVKLSPVFRGLGVTEDVFDWLQSELGVGRDIELLALAPQAHRPSAMAHFGLELSHHVYKWPLTRPGEAS
ncbi:MULTISPECIES: hypothetical protein [unclassified Streptomyces]|uniref:hypothetical protein n=1 Tax=unclassified Streptomyces TaxID=2593676 RepID=UPI002365A5D3|nr:MULTISPECIES: hypothetical protein [unclassified Streptomyces]MDF3142785.1 hypothetical protein [Streptomyces sp. T21Q-yed]WDF42868.1 hypothetical protein PBV52_41795 [Streptomyces sp. T12]